MDIKETFEKIMNNYNDKIKERFDSNSNMYQLIVNNSRLLLTKEIENNINSNMSLEVKGSCGTDGWTYYPWITIFNPEITKTIQEGVYVVYLFSQDMKRVYLTLNQGFTNLKKQLGSKKCKEVMSERRAEIRNTINKRYFIANNNLNIGKDEYEEGCIFYKEYKIDDMPNNEVFIEDLKNMISIYEEYYNKMFLNANQDFNNQIVETVLDKNTYTVLSEIQKYIKSKGYLYSEKLIYNIYLSLKTKPFVILSGISGTGKSKLVKLLAESLGSTSENGRFTLVPVRPDWSDSSELLGYKDLNSTFHPGILTTVIEEASKEDNKNYPYFVCLDEMNLARVEYYLSDILSVIESRYTDENGEIKTDKLIRKELLGNDQAAIQKYSNLYIPENMYIIGTVNMDETTFPFSKKVLDRANTIEFNEVNLEFNFDSFNDKKEVEIQEYTNSFLKSKYIKLIDCKDEKDKARKIINQLIKINKILEKYNQHFGYRVRDEIVYYCLYALEDKLFTFEEAIDYCIVQKILPKIGGSDEDILDLLIDLYNELNDTKYTRDDFDSNRYIKSSDIYKLTNKKILIMVRRFVRDGFTNFWQ